MKEKIKTLIVGMIIGALLVPTVFATVGTVTKELSYNDIKITLNGKEVKPTDSDGNYVEPFIIDGTTYLPVRGVANALDLDVDWDGVTNTVKLSNDKTSSGSSLGKKTQVGDIVFDELGVKATLTDIQERNSLNTYYFLIENTTDRIAYFKGDDISVNDFMVESELGCGAIQPNKKATAFFVVAKGEYSTNKISNVEKIEINIECSTRGGSASDVENCEKTIILNF